MISAGLYYGSGDTSWLSIYAFGARALKKASVSAWAEPALGAFVAGCGGVVWTDDTLYWVAKPRLYRDAQRRLHNDDGPAVDCAGSPIYAWRGVVVPDEWIKDRASLSAQNALTWANVEQRRAACEIVGWHRILAELRAKTIDRHADPQIGELVEVELPDAGRERFLRVMCGTGREFALPVPSTMRTAVEAQAWTWGLDPKEFQQPEIRT